MAENDEHETESLVEVAVLKCARHVVTGIRIKKSGRAVFRIAENPAATPIAEIVEALYDDRYGANPWPLLRAYRDVSQDMHITLDAARGGKRSRDDERDEHEGSEAPGA